MSSTPASKPNSVVHDSAALITCEAGSETMSIDLNVQHGAVALHKVMSRPTAEGADKTVERMRMVFAPKPAKGAKGVKITREDILSSCPVIKFFGRGGEEVPVSLTNGEFWAMVASIHIGMSLSDESQSYAVVPVVYNYPMIMSVSPPPALYVGHDASCYGFGCVFCSVSDLEHQWLVDDDHILCERQVFVPTAEHVGLPVRCRVRPKASDGRNPQAWYEVVGVPTVSVTPEAPIRDGMTKRWELTRKSAFAKYCVGVEEGGPKVCDALRIVSYNILNDAFATTNWARNVLYPFASDEVRSMGFRQGAILNELRNYNAELLCLQEVGESMYRKYLGPMLTESGFGHYYAAKSGMVRDGCAIAYSTRRFECVSSFKLPLTLTTLRANHPELSEELRIHHPHLEYDLSKVVSVGAYTVLKDFGGAAQTDSEGQRHAGAKPERYVIVGNTHLFYRPNGCHIRAIQALMHATILHKEYTKIVEALSSEGPDVKVHLVLAGDCNFTAQGGAHKLLTNGLVDSQHECWDKGAKFWWGCEDGDEEDDSIVVVGVEKKKVARVAGVPSGSSPPSTPQQPAGPPVNIFKKDVQLPSGLKFESTHEGRTGAACTVFGDHFSGIIDHIFVATAHSDDCESITTLGIVPLPSIDELRTDVAIPSSTYPSDHVAIVAEVGFQRKR